MTDSAGIEIPGLDTAINIKHGYGISLFWWAGFIPEERPNEIFGEGYMKEIIMKED